jgi:hypothetical protein
MSLYDTMIRRDVCARGILKVLGLGSGFGGMREMFGIILDIGHRPTQCFLSVLVVAGRWTVADGRCSQSVHSGRVPGCLSPPRFALSQQRHNWPRFTTQLQLQK